MKFKYWPYVRHITYFIQRITTVVSYLPVLWNDFDFDKAYILILLKKKLERMAPVFKDGHFEKSSAHHKEIKICINLLGRLIADDYRDNAYGEIEKKLGKIKITYEGLEFSIEEGNNYSKEYCDRVRKAAYTKMNNRRKADTDLLFKIMSRKIHNWWEQGY